MARGKVQTFSQTFTTDNPKTMKPVAKGSGVNTTKKKPPGPLYPQKLAKIGTVPIGSVRLYSYDPELLLQCDMGNDRWKISDGFGGWTTQERNQRPQQTIWPGRATFKLVGDIWLDRFAEGGSVEPEVSVLEQMAQLPDGYSEPPLLNIDGSGGIPHDFHSAPDSFWVLNDIQYKDEEINASGQLSRCTATLTFLEYQGDAFALTAAAKESSAAKRKKSKKKGKGSSNKVYTVKAGDTLKTIAAHQLGNANRWHEIANLNHLNSPTSIHTGQRITLR